MYITMPKENRSKNFVESFQKMIDIIIKDHPEWMSYWIVIYARDMNDRTKEYPDGEVACKVVQRVTAYDRMAIRQFCEESFIRKH